MNDIVTSKLHKNDKFNNKLARVAYGKKYLKQPALNTIIFLQGNDFS